MCINYSAGNRAVSNYAVHLPYISLFTARTLLLMYITFISGIDLQN